MRVALCIASRGNPRRLCETLNNVLHHCALPQTMAVVGLDDDDPTLADALTGIESLQSRRIILSQAPRTDTIGAVYNRCAAAIDADLYINSADDFRILSPGWDSALSYAADIFSDGIGLIGFGEMPVPSWLPACEAATRGLIEKMGYFVQDYTPYWWTDTWLCEIAMMIGRMDHVPMQVAFAGPMQTRGLRELPYWGRFFDETRICRRAIAEAILSSPEFHASAEERQKLRGDLAELCATFETRNSVLRDADYTLKVEGRGYDAPADERYRRAKDRSLAILREVQSGRACVA